MSQSFRNVMVPCTERGIKQARKIKSQEIKSWFCRLAVVASGCGTVCASGGCCDDGCVGCIGGHDGIIDFKLFGDFGNRLMDEQSNRQTLVILELVILELLLQLETKFI